MGIEEPKFNPSDEEYKKVEDLPRIHRDKYVNLEDGGFVGKEADEALFEAEKEADANLTAGRTTDVKPIDILQDRALEKDKKRTELLSDIQQKKLNEEYLQGRDWLRYEEKLEDEILRKKTFINEWKDDRELLKQLAIHYSEFDDYLPEELWDDKSFILELMQGGRYLYNKYSSVSERLKNDPETMKLIRNNGRVDDGR